MRTHEPARKLDLLLTGALIEARSCERFRLLGPRFSGELERLGQFYLQLERSEARHFKLYLSLAGSRYPVEWQERLAILAQAEGRLATSPDPDFRFHSGAPLTQSSTS
jgi:tRNA-(ms[2]io[6]A)-hydroxylase